NTQGAKIAVANSMEIPDSKGVKVHHACNVRISTDNMGGFQTVINGQVPSTYYATGAGKRFYVVDYAGTKEPETWTRPTSSVPQTNENP
ncbi:glycoside hydrolase family 16, partial [bacterium]|nr:glycoside hydrolase family 16 [bacterium]